MKVNTILLNNSSYKQEKTNKTNKFVPFKDGSEIAAVQFSPNADVTQFKKNTDLNMGADIIKINPVKAVVARLMKVLKAFFNPKYEDIFTDSGDLDQLILSRALIL